MVSSSLLHVLCSPSPLFPPGKFSMPVRKSPGITKSISQPIPLPGEDNVSYLRHTKVLQVHSIIIIVLYHNGVKVFFMYSVDSI